MNIGLGLVYFLYHVSPSAQINALETVKLLPYLKRYLVFNNWLKPMHIYFKIINFSHLDGKTEKPKIMAKEKIPEIKKNTIQILTT